MQQTDYDALYDASEAAMVPVHRAAAGAPCCEKQLSRGDLDAARCGGSCLRPPGHDGLCLCCGDHKDVPGTCPA
jgi:hypothetical protein